MKDTPKLLSGHFPFVVDVFSEEDEFDTVETSAIQSLAGQELTEFVPLYALGDILPLLVVF